MNYLDYINSLEVCEEAGLEVYSNAGICRENSHEEGPEMRKTVFHILKKNGKKIMEILDAVYISSLVLISYM